MGYQGIWALLSLFIAVYGKDCVWDKSKAFPKNPPLMLDSQNRLVLPVVLENNKKVITVVEGANMTLACPGSILNSAKVESTEATCIGNTMLSVNGKRYSLKRLGCTKKIKSSIRRGVGQCGTEGKEELEAIGFNITVSTFYDMIRVCYDPQAETTLYTDHVLHGSHINAKDIDTKRPSFKVGSGFFDVKILNCYAKKTQFDLMRKLLGRKSLASAVINPSKQHYFAKGHMSPDADFVTEVEQDATYYYINALPQWQAFNNGNWKYLEFATRALAEKLGRDLRVYSGGHGLLKLADKNKNLVDIYLGMTEDKKVVPAPEVTWKVVHDESTKQAAAIIGVNNPHLKTPPKPLCSGSCGDLGWIDFNVEDLAHGYTYCCTVEDLRKAVPYVPDVGEVSLLAVEGGGNNCGK